MKLLIVNSARPPNGCLQWLSMEAAAGTHGRVCVCVFGGGDVSGLFSLPPSFSLASFGFVSLIDGPAVSRTNHEKQEERVRHPPSNNKTCGEVFGRFVLSAGIKCRDLRWKCRRLSGKSYAPRGISGLLGRNSFVQANEV